MATKIASGSSLRAPPQHARATANNSIPAIRATLTPVPSRSDAKSRRTTRPGAHMKTTPVASSASATSVSKAAGRHVHPHPTKAAERRHSALSGVSMRAKCFRQDRQRRTDTRVGSCLSVRKFAALCAALNASVSDPAPGGPFKECVRHRRCDHRRDNAQADKKHGGILSIYAELRPGIIP